MIGFRAVKERKGETAWDSAQLLCLQRDPSGRCLAEHLPEFPWPRSQDRGTLVNSGFPLWLCLGGARASQQRELGSIPRGLRRERGEEMLS